MVLVGYDPSLAKRAKERLFVVPVAVDGERTRDVEKLRGHVVRRQGLPYLQRPGQHVSGGKYYAALALAHWHNVNGPSELEANTAAAALAEPLRALGHEVKIERMRSGLTAIRRDASGWSGAADPRRDGAAVGR